MYFQLWEYINTIAEGIGFDSQDNIASSDIFWYRYELPSKERMKIYILPAKSWPFWVFNYSSILLNLHKFLLPQTSLQKLHHNFRNLFCFQFFIYFCHVHPVWTFGAVSIGRSESYQHLKKYASESIDIAFVGVLLSAYLLGRCVL